MKPTVSCFLLVLYLHVGCYAQGLAAAIVPAHITVYVMGDLTHGGTFQLPAGAKLIDAIQAGGGFSPEVTSVIIIRSKGPKKKSRRFGSYKPKDILEGLAGGVTLCDKDCVICDHPLCTMKF